MNIHASQAGSFIHHADKGSERWWASIAKTGTPLQQPSGNGEIDVTFLWRDPDGIHSDYARVYLDVYSHTAHPTHKQTSMKRIENTDIWFWQTQLPADWCGSYFFMPATNRELPPPSADRKTLRRWWIELMQTNAQADPLNRHPVHNNGWGLALSAIQLPDADVHWAWRHQYDHPQGHLQQHLWDSQRLGNARTAWVYRTGTADVLPLVILLDGHYWAKHMPVFAPLDVLTAQGELPPAVYVLIDALNPAARSHELPCNENFWLAIQEELLPQLQLSNSDPLRTLVAGQSFGGLSALYAALRWPEKFGLVLSQSGSFWWPNPDETGDQGALVRTLMEAPRSNKNLKVLVEVGCYESGMVGVNRAMYDALRAQGMRVIYREFRGGHDWNCWRHGLLHGLCQLLNLN